MLDDFTPATRHWFAAAFAAATPVQEAGWKSIAAGSHSLLLAPTGSGKTLAAFLWAIDTLLRLPPDAPPGVRVLYISPLKALVYDIERNLRAPLVGTLRAAEQLNQTCRKVRVDVRTGDTPPADRRRQARDPADILVTTPESLYLLLGSKAADSLRQVHTIIVDEIHALAPSKRGAHMALSLERLSAWVQAQGHPEPQRIGLSATVRPHQEAARYLAGQRPVTVVDKAAPAHIDLQIIVPVADMEKPPPLQDPAPAVTGGPILGQLMQAESRRKGAKPPKSLSKPQTAGMWAAIYPVMLQWLQAQRSTIIFVNSRSLCERLAQRLNELADEELVRAHHGSLSLRKRAEIEEALKAGSLRGIVATSSLELGIDMGSVDLVVLVESPGSVARGLQRVGRAGHGVGQISRGIIFPKFRGDLLECTVVAQRMRAGALEPIVVPQNCLDVLSQQLVAMCIAAPVPADTLYATVTRSYPYHTLTRTALVAVLEMLSGTYPSDEFAELRPHLSWDRSTDVVSIRRGGRLAALLNAGTIVDRGMFAVHLVGDGPRLGELDEEMVHESRKGDTFLLGASTWRIEEIGRDRVLVSPAPGEPGKMPFWRGDGPGRPIELGRAIGAFLREVQNNPVARTTTFLQKEQGLDPFAAGNLASYIHGQKEHTGTLPTDRSITIERFRDEMGDWRVCILSPFGSRVHAPWALALESILGKQAGYAIQTMYSDDGIVVRFADSNELPDTLDALLLDPAEVEELVMQQLAQSALFASHFRENASRALLLPRRLAQMRMPLWQQRLRAKTLLAAAQRYPSFPIVLETYRQCLRDIFDIPALVELMGAIRRREVHVQWVQSNSASPFARSLAFAYVAAYLYEGDSPLAERKAQALTLDRELLSELLGQAQLRELIDPAVLHEVEAQLHHLHPGHRARDANEVHDMLRRLGDLTAEELQERCEGTQADLQEYLDSLQQARRVIAIRLAGDARFIAAEDAGRYRDAFGVMPTGGLPQSFVQPVPDPLKGLVRRFARTHGPFLSEAVAARFGVLVPGVEAILQALETEQVVLRGELRPGGVALEWCDTEVLRRLKRATLARLRREVAAVEAKALGRFLPRWHGLSAPRSGLAALQDAVAQLEGLALPWSALGQALLPARVSDFHLDMLDMLCATGAIVWLGCGSLGSHDGRIKLLRRTQAPLLLDAPAAYMAPSPLHAAIMAHLGRRGACFTVELQAAAETSDLQALQSALWDLVWAGQITCDTLTPLRSLGSRAPRGRGPSRQGGRRSLPRASSSAGFGGRWSKVGDLLGHFDVEQGAAAGAAALPPATPTTQQAYARATGLLERYGIVSRDVVAAEDMPGGFAAVYKVFKAMEEAGKVRRGFFVEGLQGAQFAYATAIERLRAQRKNDEALGAGKKELQVLCALDPANPYGTLLPWPPRPHAVNAQKPRRVSGATLVLLEGEPLVYVEPTGRSLMTFGNLWEQDGAIAFAMQALRGMAAVRRGQTLHLHSIDGTESLQHPQMAALEQAGMLRTFDGLLVSGQAQSPPPTALRRRH